MEHDLITALTALRPNSEWLFDEDDGYSGLTWLDSGTTKPTEDEINNKITELNNAEPMKVLRRKRNGLLESTDWTQQIDIPEATRTKWQSYRQELRDLPANQTPSDINLSNITWPTKPS